MMERSTEMGGAKASENGTSKQIFQGLCQALGEALGEALGGGQRFLSFGLGVALLVMGLLASGLLGCGADELVRKPGGSRGGSKGNGSVWLPWPDADGQYRVQRIFVETVSQWSPLRGTAVQLQGHVKKGGNDTWISQEVEVEHLFDTDGSVIPITRFAVEAAATYVHFERLQKWDRRLNLLQADKTRNVYMKYVDPFARGRTPSNSAYYDMELDSFFILPYKMNRLPLSVNGGVLAHEHFHSIFARLVLRPLITSEKAPSGHMDPHSEMRDAIRSDFDLTPSPPSPEEAPPSRLEKSVRVVNISNRFVNRIILRGLNEGLADVWGWLYTQDPCFMKISFKGGLPESRCLAVATQESLQLMTVADLREFYDPFYNENALAISVSYIFGTNIARMIYRRVTELEALTDETDDNRLRAQWAQHLVNRLPEIHQMFVKPYLDPQQAEVFPLDEVVDRILFSFESDPQISSESATEFPAEPPTAASTDPSANSSANSSVKSSVKSSTTESSVSLENRSPEFCLRWRSILGSAFLGSNFQRLCRKQFGAEPFGAEPFGAEQFGEEQFGEEQ